jgi:CCR4-NOT transcriptional regulation complex NOT5 subunit
MKDKYELEMKKEIKKLQRIRDYFRQSDIKDMEKAKEARRRVEKVSITCGFLGS